MSDALVERTAVSQVNKFTCILRSLTGTPYLKAVTDQWISQRVTVHLLIITTQWRNQKTVKRVRNIETLKILLVAILLLTF